VPIFHRVDDVYACRPDLMRILAAFEHWNLTAIVAVIPKRLTAEMAVFLAARPQFLVYQHGHEHRNHALAGRKDEFPSSRDLSDVVTIVATGRKLIERAVGRPINGYVPPWNTASTVLVEALIQLRFTHVSANRSAAIPSPLVHRPYAVDTLESYAPVRVRPAAETIEHLEAARQCGATAGVVHHIKDLGEQGMRDVEAVIAWSSAHRMPDEVWRTFAGQVPTSAA
jgi:hypothetical protein